VIVQQHRDIVVRIEDIARANLGEPLHLLDLCKSASVTEHSVRNAFRHVYGATPCRHLREFRMREARKALLAPGPKDRTVTDVAMRFGFFEIGRFAVRYRLTFGESPSTTLRRASQAARELERENEAVVPLRRLPDVGLAAADSMYAAR
jgi:transcriptional regulator GlxA family with amidase domain